MLRRRLAVYTLLYIAGIAAGFFIFERSRVLEAAGFCTAVMAAVVFSELPDKQKVVLALMFAAGCLLFSLRYMAFSSDLKCIDDKDYLRGRVTSVSVKDEKARMIIRNRDAGPKKVMLTIDASALEDEAYRYIGAAAEAGGEYTGIPSADDPGCFDYSLYMKGRGVTTGFKAYILEISSERPSPAAVIRRSLCNARETFIDRFDEDTQGFIRGVIFGDKSGIDEDVLDEFNSNSTGHILAVSGLHVGFLYGLLRFLTARRRTLPVSLLIMIVILLYGEMTMWSPATVRACIVMTVSLCSTHLRRSADLLTSVSLAAMLILTSQPYQLFSSGFQLSFLALCGIAFLTGPVSSVAGEAIAVMLAVQIGTLPVIAFSYCSINPLSMLINVPVIMLASVLVPVCILMLMLQIIAGGAPAAGIDLAELISYAVVKVNHILSFGGGFSIRTAGPGAAVIILLYAAIFGFASEWTRVMLLRGKVRTVLKHGVLLLMPLAMLFSCLYDTISDDEIVFVAVGQGDCVHIRSDSHDVLIDGGGQASYGHGSSQDEEESEGYNVGKNILMPYLMHGGADAADIALVTHLHADHYKGIEELSEVFPVGAIGIPADYRDSCAEILGRAQPGQGSGREKRPEIICIDPSSKIDISEDVYIDTLWPAEISDEPFAADDPNEHNTVYMIHYKDIKIMVTGDLLEADEKKMVEYYHGTDKLECDILKVAHHGSKSSSCEEFLDAAKPDIAVIQCGRNNFYGHPHRQTLERLEERGIRVFRTDISGAVGIDIHGRGLSVDLFK